MIVYFNRQTKREAWGGGSHFITAFYDFLKGRSHSVVFDLIPDIDVIFMFDPRQSKDGEGAIDLYNYKSSNPSVKIVQRINDTDIARPLDKPWRVKMLLEANQIADHTIFISEWVKNHYLERGFNNKNPNTVIINGCNSEWYYPGSPKSLDNNIKLITHHWSDNFMKGFDVYNFLDRFVNKRENISFTYMGRYNKNYSPSNIKIIPPVYGIEIGDILRDHDIYVTGARFEACGMHHIEAASCGLPILYHRDGGAVPEVCKSHGLEFFNVDNFVSSLDNVILNYDNIRSKIDYKYLSFKRCFSEYENIILDFKKS
jgi:glycosyltransferase involved in cell wall biosynthesis